MGNGNYELSLPDGSTVTIAPETASKIQQYMRNQNGGGGGQLAQLGDAVQLGANIIEGFALRSRLDDVRASQDRLDKARTAFEGYLTELGSAPVPADQLMHYLGNIEDAQDRLDSDQNSAMGVVLDALVVQVFGAGARVLDRASGGSGGMSALLGSGGGSNTVVDVALGAAGGFGLAELFNSNRGRRRRRD